MHLAAVCACLLVLVAFATPNMAAIQCHTCGNAGEFMCPEKLSDATATTSTTATHCYLKYDVETMSYRMGVVVTQADCGSTTDAIACCDSEKCNNNLALLTQPILEQVMKPCYSCGLPGLCSETATGNPLSKNKCFMCSASIVSGTKMLGCESTCIDSAEPPFKKCCAASTGTSTAGCNNEYVTDASKITLSCYDCGDPKSVAATCPSPFSPFKVGIVKGCKACKAVKTSATSNAILSCVTTDPTLDPDCKNHKCCYSSFCNRIYPTDSATSVNNGISYSPVRQSFMWAFPTLIIGLGLHLVSMN